MPIAERGRVKPRSVLYDVCWTLFFRNGCAVVLCQAFASTGGWKCVEVDYLNISVYPW